MCRVSFIDYVGGVLGKELVARPCAKELVVSQVRAPRFRLIFGFEF